MTPRVFVGTMECGEGDFPECVAAVAAQAGCVVTHHVVNDLPEKEAHNALWSAWRAAQSGHDLFVKVDADTVLANSETLLSFWRVMEANPRVTGIQAPLLDYFTAGYINGLNCFSPRVTFCDTLDELFCDRRVDVDHDVIVGSGEVPDQLKPAGYHCYRPTDAQAFHFGLHRALKRQTATLERVREAYKREGGRARALALLGAETAASFSEGGFNYADERFKVALDGVMRRFGQLTDGL